MSEAVVHRLVWEDLGRFQSLLYDLPEVRPELRSFQGRAKEEWWEPPPVYSDMPRLAEPDLWHLVGVATIVMAPEVAEELGGFLHAAGELLPLRMSGTNRTLFALNILRDVDCLDPTRYRPQEGDAWTDFIEHRLDESGLFKVPQLDDVEIFHLERSDDDERLPETIERNGYRGVRFEPVWADDGSVSPVNLLAA